MQQPASLGSRRSCSPVFFTGCTSSSPNAGKCSAKEITPQDFENLKLIVNACKLLPPRPVLLPLPSKEVGTNGIGNSKLFDSFSPEVSTPAQSPLIPNPPQSHCLQSTPDSSLNETPTKVLLPSPQGERSIPNVSPDYHSGMRKRKSSDRNFSPDAAAKLPRRSLPVSNQRLVWEELSQDIWKLYHKNKQTSEVYRMKMKLRDQLHQMLLTTFPNCGLYVVGSSMTGLGANSSDMDMCLMLTHSEIDQEQEATEILQVVYDTFMHYDFLTDVELIPAKVPILRFRDFQSDIEVDLNINNSVGIRNTQLLTSYSRMDKRVPPLVLLTKLWARCHGINDAKNHSLSSYSLVLMVIHYLQYGCSPPVLPSLQQIQPEKFKPFSDVRTLSLNEELPHFVSHNTAQLSELFLGFLDYFANKFDFDHDVISVRKGGVLPKLYSMNNTASPKNKRGHWKHICIEEPFNQTNTACSVFKENVYYYIRDVFLRSWNQLRSSCRLSSILDLESW